jgi:hypothetical protein
VAKKLQAAGQTLEVAAEFTEHGVEYDLDGETFVTLAANEEDARLMRAALKGLLVVRTVYETAWALAPDA